MGWFNYVGLILILVMMVPNIAFMLRKREDTTSSYSNKWIEAFEQIGRYGCFFLMVFNIPYTYYGFWFDNAFLIYIVINSTLLIIYLMFWIICWNGRYKLRAYILSIVPSLMFLFSGTILAYYPLIALAIIFAICHITISIKSL
jgi:hypothetical protein